MKNELARIIGIGCFIEKDNLSVIKPVCAIRRKIVKDV